jgi:protein arginine N-methyltransferase 1
MYGKIFKHRQLLEDDVRLEAYRKAIHEVVKPGDVVADIGTGSGILAFFAAQSGARKVYAIEQSEIIEEAERLAKVNGFGGKIIFIKGRSDRVELPEKADVITSEIIGCFGLDENVLKFKTDARERFLKPGGTLIPSCLELYLVPVESEPIWKDYVGLWDRDYYGVDFSPVRNYAVSQRYVTDCSKKVTTLATPAMTAHINFHQNEKMSLVLQGKSVVDQKGILHGLVGFQRIGLSDNIGISTSFEKPLTNWSQNFFPIERAVTVQRRDEVIFKVIPIFHKDRFFWRWETGVYRHGDEIARFDQTDLNIRKEEFLIRQEDFNPILNEIGEISREVFDLCDGRKTMGEIAESISAKYPWRYQDADAAFGTVVGVLRRKLNVN